MVTALDWGFIPYEGECMLWEFLVSMVKSLPATAVLVGLAAYLFKKLLYERLKNAVAYEYDVKFREKAHEYDVKLREVEDDLRRKTEIELVKINSRLTFEVELAKIKAGPYSGEQFTLYNKLWASLCDLKFSMLTLWEGVSEAAFDKFARQLEETTLWLEKSALLVEPTQYDQLITLLNEFDSYSFGKRTLMQHRQQRELGYNFIDHNEMQKMINDNRDKKNRLLNYLPKIRDSLRSQISGKGSAKED
jgi:hypothetical protein